jgi:thioredoxin-like negative regulator of GroEL
LGIFKRGRLQILTMTLPGEAAVVAVSRLPRAADALLLPLARARIGNVPEEGAAALAQTLRQGAALAPDDPLSRIAEARAASLAGDPADARARLEALLAADETNTEARYLLASLILEAARGADGEQARQALTDARRQVARGFRHNPNHFPTLYLYGLLRAWEPGPMSEQDLNVLARALELAPQSDHIRLLLAEELIEAERFVEAVVNLRPIIYSRHGGQRAVEARRLFDAAREHRQPPPPPPTDSNPETETTGP